MAQDKILFITVRADHGGGPRLLYLLLKGIKNTFDLLIASPDDKPYFVKYVDEIGSESIIEIPHRKFSFRKLIELSSVIKKNKISLVHSHGKGAGVYSRLLKILTGVKVIHTFHGLHIGKYSSYQKYFYLKLERFFSNRSDKIIACSNSEAASIIKNKICNKDKIEIINNGVPVPDLSVQLEDNKNEIKIATITRFDYAKNPMLLLNVCKELINLKQTFDFKFIIIGEGENSTEFKDKIKKEKLVNYFAFKGAVDNPTKELNDCFCYISTSRWEGLPLSVLEAMAIGLPVVATDVPGNIDLINHNENGFLFNLNEPEKAAGFITELVKNQSKWNQFSQQNKQIVKTNYSSDVMVKKYKSLYYDILN